MSEYAKNIQTIEDLWKKRIELRDGGGRMREYIITDKQMGLIQDFANVCVEGEKLPEIVRCHDCKFGVDGGKYCAEGCADSWDWRNVEPDGFCAWGERRES